jgi:hypothetical protein
LKEKKNLLPRTVGVLTRQKLLNQRNTVRMFNGGCDQAHVLKTQGRSKHVRDGVVGASNAANKKAVGIFK